MGNLDFSRVFDGGDMPEPSQVDAGTVVEDLWPAYVDMMHTHLDNLEAAALAFESGKDRDENAAAIKRLLHSIKGDSGMIGLDDLHRFCHLAESAFDELPTDPAKADMVFRAKDWMQDVIDHIRTHGFRKGLDESESPASPDVRKLRALIIDDDHLCRKRIRMLIGDFCECTLAQDGQKGYELFKQALEAGEPFDLVTLDIQMPRMNGHQTLEAIRQLEQEHGIHGLDGTRIIMTTSHDTSKHVFGAFRKGCEAYVVKQDVGEKLLAEMANLGLLKAKVDYTVG